jgi:hypothetical protein
MPLPRIDADAEIKCFDSSAFKLNALAPASAAAGRLRWYFSCADAASHVHVSTRSDKITRQDAKKLA